MSAWEARVTPPGVRPLERRFEPTDGPGSVRGRQTSDVEVGHRFTPARQACPRRSFGRHRFGVRGGLRAYAKRHRATGWIVVNIYVGNLPYDTTEADLIELFSEFGEVVKTVIIFDRDTGRSKGYGFVEMAQDDEGAAAIESLSGGEFRGRYLTINEARNRQTGAVKQVSSRGYHTTRSREDIESASESRGYSNAFLKQSTRPASGSGDVQSSADPAGRAGEDPEPVESSGGYSNRTGR